MTLLVALTLFACDDASFSDPHLMPVKVSGLRIQNISHVKPMPDGTVAYPVSGNGGVKVAKINRDGTVSYSEFVDDVDPTNFFVNASGECLVTGKKVAKLYRDGRIAFVGDSDFSSVLLDNGDICYPKFFSFEGNQMEIHTLGNNFVYVINCDEQWTDVLPFDDKWFAFNYSNLFCIYDADGNVVCNGELDGSVASLNYIDGCLYLIVNSGFQNLDTDSTEYITKWSLVKMTIDGRIIYSTAIDISDIYNLTVHDGKLFLSGDVMSYIAKDGTYGIIYVLDDDGGGIMSTVAIKYNGCQVIPLHVSPDSNGEYDVYAARRDNYESGYPHLVIYHTDDLNKLIIKN